MEVVERAEDFVAEMWSHDGPGSEMHIGDLAWGVFHRWPSALGAVRLWPDSAGCTQALTMFDGSGVCDLVVRPGRAGLDAARQALGWAEEKRRAAAPPVSEPIELRVGRRVRSAGLVDLLHERGFERLAVGVPATSRTLAVSDLPTPSVPQGFDVRELREDDIDSRVQAFGAAFPGDVLRVDAYRALRRSPSYVEGLDVVAVSPSSDVAAFATLWLDPLNAVVQIEPAGCHPDHRRLGLTRAVILHALRRSVDLGATRALVRHVSTNVAAKALYESCGFVTASEHTGFAKQLTAGGGRVL